MCAYLAVVDANHGADHLRHHNHVTHVRAHDGGLLVRLSLLLGLAQLLDEGHRLALQLCGGSSVVAIPVMVSALPRAGRTSSTV